MRGLLHGLAAGVLIGGVGAAAVLPERSLDFCIGLGFGGCTGWDPLVLRAIVATVAGFAALTIWMIGSTARQ